jgi:hypothetical protein
LREHCAGIVSRHPLYTLAFSDATLSLRLAVSEPLAGSLDGTINVHFAVPGDGGVLLL